MKTIKQTISIAMITALTMISCDNVNTKNKQTNEVSVKDSVDINSTIEGKSTMNTGYADNMPYEKDTLELVSFQLENDERITLPINEIKRNKGVKMELHLFTLTR